MTKTNRQIAQKRRISAYEMYLTTCVEWIEDRFGPRLTLIDTLFTNIWS